MHRADIALVTFAVSCVCEHIVKLLFAGLAAVYISRCSFSDVRDEISR